jgi:hypothetical protein
VRKAAKIHPAGVQNPLDSAEHVGNKPVRTKNEHWIEKDTVMLALAINLLFAIAAAAATFSLVDSALKAGRAYAMLMRERALMGAGFTMQVDPREVRLRAAARHAGAVILPRRSPMLRPLPALARGVA